jgi:Fe2+ transport system protein FeoA
MKTDKSYCNKCELNIHDETTPLDKREFGCKAKHEDAIPLAEGKLDKDYKILCNDNQKYLELGMYHGSIVRIIKNNEYDRNIVVAVGSSRYIISRNVAKFVMVIGV